MSTDAPSQPTAPAVPPAPVPAPACAVVIDGSLRVPAGINDQASFRAWTHSEGFPERGRICWLAGTLWIELTMEQLYSYNDVKTVIASVLLPLARQLRVGRYFGDGMQLSVPTVNLTTVPDGLFVSFACLQSGRVRQIPSPRYGGVTELEGAPEMVLEVVSESSIEKDTVLLPPLYHQAGVEEFWYVDARGPDAVFEILRRAPTAYQPTRLPDGWWRSDTFNRDFRLVAQADPLGQPEFILDVRP